MFNKAPRQTSFHSNSQTPGPGAYNPKDPKKSASHALPFGKQPDRFKREDSSLSTGSNSTTSSVRSNSQQMRSGRIQERLRTFEVQIRERDQIISRLKMDKLAALSRYQVLVDAYKQLRRVSVQSIPSQKLPKDISHEIMRILQEEKQQSKDESRPSMCEKDIKDHMATFIVEMEQVDDPRLSALEKEKAALGAELEETKKRVEKLDEENQNLKKEVGESAYRIGQLTGSLRASEAKDSEIKSLTLQLQRANALVDSMNSNASTRDDKLFATLKELGDVKATQAALENTVAQQAKKLEENQAKYERNSEGLKVQLESKANEVRELEQRLTQLTVALRASQDEREGLARELSNTAEHLEKIIQEKGSLALKSNSVEGELNSLKQKCRDRKAELSAAEDRLNQERSRSEELSNQLNLSRIELEELRKEVHRRELEAASERQTLQNQLTQSQENFERQIDEARKMHEILEGHRAETEAELKLAINRMRTLENQVQERDELLSAAQLEKESLRGKVSQSESLKGDLEERLSRAEVRCAELEQVSRTNEDTAQKVQDELTKLMTQFVDMELLNNAKEAEVKSLQMEISELKELNSEMNDSLRRAMDETAAEREKLRALENETSSIKLLHLATTAELEETKIALRNASDDSTKVDALKLDLATVEAEKARLTALVKSLEEQVESWVRVRDSLTKQLNESEQRYQEAMDAHMSQMKLRENNIKILEEHLSSVKGAHEDELNSLKKNSEQDRERLSRASADHLREVQEKFSAEKSELLETMEKIKIENELLKSETASLIDAKASFSLQLQAKESEVLHLRNKAAEADFYGSKCRELENQSLQMRENIAILHEDVQATRQELIEVQQALENANRANEAHAMFTLAVINSGSGGQQVEALQTENENLRHQLSTLNELMDRLETGIETSEAKNSVYVKSCAQMQEQIQRLVGHSNNKQRIQYVGKLQTENRELKEEQAKLRSKVDAMQKKVSQMETQLRKQKDKENRLDTMAGNTMSVTQSRYY
ncbi:hyaluronan mediated motility receptor [Galendromus occidentalis]|uniref:Hyaluronan mediated motility receptor n=1 Tax=Galendromus occidentalis TaxID=34638 RepID=A0AAJ7SGJ8_9ACAR|nr:hyaluronan mediated motility receptor [Galendromus occidentalis]